MRAAVFNEPWSITVADRPDAAVAEPTDAVVRVVLSCVCGSDLWYYRGESPFEPGPIGHEFVGVVEDVGADVRNVAQGDFVIAPFAFSDGTCPHCRHGITSACATGGFFPMNGDGGQGEAVRVPLADGTLVPVPGSGHSDDLMASLLALSDVMATGHHAAMCASVKAGDVVAVVGDGAVGLCGILAAARLGADRIIALSRNPDRQKLARDFGATDMVEQRGQEATEAVLALTDGVGVDATLECVGTGQSMDTALSIARPGSMVGYVGVPHGVELPLQEMFFRNKGVQGGSAPVRAYIPELLDDVLDGHLDPALSYIAAQETWSGHIEPGSLEQALELQRRERLQLAYTDSPNLVLGLRLMAADRLDEARDLFQAEAEEAERHGDDYTYSSLLVYLTELECRAANFQTAAAHASECWLRSEQRGEQYQGGAALWAKALADAHLGRVEEARAAAQLGTRLSTEIGEEVYRILNRCALGFLELSLGDVARADAILRTLPPRLVDLGWDEPSLYPVWPNAIEALIGVGDPELAARYLDLFRERALRCDCPWALATSARCEGQLLLAEGDTAGALAACDQALDEHRRTPGGFERCRTLLTLGSAQRRARTLRDAREILGQAVAGFDELGAPLWAKRARAELGRIGGRTSSRDELTPAEQRVAALVAGGKTNKEVAAALVVSVHTVEAALTQVYRKLDVRSRTELARRYPPPG